MLPIQEPAVRERMLHGHFGLEKESLRVDASGRMAHTPHPFPGDAHIVRDFCENQTEINTPALRSAQEAVAALAAYDAAIQRRLVELDPPEYLWPFSNPALLQNEKDIPVAQFYGELAGKTAYREYLSDRYGRYKMTLSGIHVNFSFDDDLIAAAFEAQGGFASVEDYRNQLYVELAEKAAAYGWLITAVTAASPLMDQSFWEKGRSNADEFCGMASVRCSELGYWNFFAPVFDYTSLDQYVDSIQRYVEDGLLRYATELYYPIRLKPAGENRLDALREGVNHIELRMVDLNPLAPAGIDVRDVEFIHLFLLWLASLPRMELTPKDQVQAVQNFKNAAHYDLKTVKIVMPSGKPAAVADTALEVLYQMTDFYRELLPSAIPVLEFETAKFTDPENRYAWIIRREFSGGFVRKGLELARQRQEAAYV